MKAVILAGGNSRRLKSHWSGVQKCLMPLFDRPAIEHLVRRLVECNFKDIMIAACPESVGLASILGDGTALGASISYSVEHQPMGTAGAVRAVSHFLDQSFIVVPADCVTDIDFAEAAGQCEGLLAGIICAQRSDSSDYGAITVDSEGLVSKFVEKPSGQDALGNTVSTSIYYLNPDLLGSIPPFAYSDFEHDVFPRLLNNREHVKAVEISGYWADIGQQLSYFEAHLDALEGKLRVQIPADCIEPGLYIGENVTIDPSARVCAPAYIGHDSRICAGASIAGRCILGAGSRIGEGTEISKSILGLGSDLAAGSRVISSMLNGTDSHGKIDLNGTCRIDQVSYLELKQPTIESATLEPKPRVLV